MMGRAVEARCRRCGKSVPSDQLVLDTVYGMVVCQLCVKERKTKEKNAEPKAAKEQEESKPAGWDEEDDYLERAARRNSQETVKVERINNEKVRYTCPKCSYKFSYSTITKTPSHCPYCNRELSTKFSF